MPTRVGCGLIEPTAVQQFVYVKSIPHRQSYSALSSPIRTPANSDRPLPSAD